jgi:hypothetical protein
VNHDYGGLVVILQGTGLTAD